MWKIVLFILFAITSVLGGGFELPEHLRDGVELLHRECQAETNVPEELIHQSRGGTLPPDKDLQCYIHCLFDKAGLIDEQKHIHLELISELLPTELQEILDAVTSKCQTVHGNDDCETAWLTVKCYFDADPEHAMLI